MYFVGSGQRKESQHANNKGRFVKNVTKISLELFLSRFRPEKIGF